MDEKVKDFYKKIQEEIKDVDFDTIEDISEFLKLVFESYAVSINKAIGVYAYLKKSFQIVEADKVKKTLGEMGINVDDFVEKPVIKV